MSRMYCGQHIPYIRIRRRQYEVCRHFVDVLRLTRNSNLPVIEFLRCTDAPQGLLSHCLIQLCLEDTWVNGRYSDPEDANLGVRFMQFWDSTGVPQ